MCPHLFSFHIQENAEKKFKKFASLFRERIFVNLKCFVDESGTHDKLGLQPGAQVAAVMGYLSWDTRWATFCGQWQEVLERYGVKTFHYSDLALGKEPYCDWPSQQIEKFMRELIAIARNNTIMGLGGLVSVQDYNAIIPDDSKYDHPYYFSFNLFFGAVHYFLRYGSQWGYTSPFMLGEKVAFIFDRQTEFEEKALRHYKYAVATDMDKRFGPIAFDGKEDHPELQAADLLVGRARKICNRLFQGRQPVSENSWDEALWASGNILTMYFDAPCLRNLMNGIKAEPKIYKEYNE